MKQEIEAVFENGVLRPLQSLTLAENAHVTITVISADDHWLDSDYLAVAAREIDPSISLDCIRQELSSIVGSMSEAVSAERGEY